MCSSRKYPYSPHRRNWNFLGGGGFCKAKQFKEMYKCNEIWTIFLLLKILFKNISHTNGKQNQTLKIRFCTNCGAQDKEIRRFRELYENEPEMAAPRLETNIRYLWRHVWWACFHDHKRFWGFREIIEFVSRFYEVYWLADGLKRWRYWFVVWKCPNTAVKVQTIEIRPTKYTWVDQT